MTIRERALDDVAILLIYGRLDFASAATLRRAVDSFLRLGCRKLLLNLAEVEDIDAAGLGTLAHICRMAQLVNASVKLVDVKPRVRELLDRTALTAAFDLCASQSEALARFEMLAAS